LPPKIVFPLSSLHAGGTEWFSLRLARGLAGRGFAPSFLIFNDEGSLGPVLKREFPFHVPKSQAYNALLILRGLPDFIRFLRAERPELVISGLLYLNVLSALAIKLSGTKTKLVAVEHLRFHASKKGGASLKTLLQKQLLRFSHFFADAVVCVSRTVAQDLQTFLCCPDRDFTVLYNPIIPDDLDALEKEPVDSLFPEQSAPRILCIGRLLPVKNHDLLLEAFAHVLREKPMAHLSLIGEGSRQAQAMLEQKCAELGIIGSVSLHGGVQNVFAYMRQADLFVLSSKDEAFGNVLVEALSCGTKVVSTRCGGPEEILCNGAFGGLSETQEPHSLAQAMLSELQTKRDPQRLRDHALAYSTARATEAYAALLRKLLALSE